MPDGKWKKMTAPEKAQTQGVGKVEDIINTFAIKTAADDEGNELGFKYGFLKEYGGYHQHK